MYETTELLNVECPSIAGPQDEYLEDMEEPDQTLATGMRLAREIAAQTMAEGRKRKPTTTTTTTTTTHDNNNDDDDTNNEKPMGPEYEPNTKTKSSKKRVRFDDECRAHDESRRVHGAGEHREIDSQTFLIDAGSINGKPPRMMAAMNQRLGLRGFR